MDVVHIAKVASTSPDPVREVLHNFNDETTSALTSPPTSPA
ncbi:MAG TPA: hypothetical protein VHE80_04930 [Acidimicrobiales bacterium]|nr:hypothetical protein [Acidimicrobiales bacterium]